MLFIFPKRAEANFVHTISIFRLGRDVTHLAGFIVLILSVLASEINTYIIPNLHISNRVNLSFKKKNLT